MTARITDDDRDYAVEIATRLGVASAPQPSLDRVARLLAELREHAHAEGVASCEGAADDAHASGYAEARASIVAQLIEGSGSHDCRVCDDTGQLDNGRGCPLCDGYGKL